VVLTAAGLALYSAWHSFDNQLESTNRNDGNGGHATIDFGGQWLMGRMLVAGHGRELYNRSFQRLVLTPAYPVEDQDPKQERSDAEGLMSWVMGTDNAEAPRVFGGMLTPLTAGGGLEAVTLLAAGQQEWTDAKLAPACERRVGGPLYPPINAFIFAPLGTLPPRVGYRVNQVFGVMLAFVAGLALALLARGRVWWPVATTAIILYPGYLGSLNLGQNAALTLSILCWGWVLLDRGRSGWAGVVWGLLAFKPVWALAFFLVPLLTGRWRMCLTMLLSGALLAAATLPFVGLHSWFDWLHVGRDAASLYNTDKNWISLSRDLLGIPRRWLLDFETPSDKRDRWQAWAIGVASLGIVFTFTAVTSVLCRRRVRETTGAGPAFLLIGAWMCCYHFMYYDVLLTALPVMLLFTAPTRWLVPRFLAVVPLSPRKLGYDVVDYYAPLLPGNYPPTVPLLSIGYHNVCVLNRLVPHLVVVLVLTQFLFFKLGLGGFYGPPWDTFVLIGMWLWLGGIVLAGAD
jgi:arabinofuranan 3-O-arabinosyltransferase